MAAKKQSFENVFRKSMRLSIFLKLFSRKEKGFSFLSFRLFPKLYRINKKFIFLKIQTLKKYLYMR